MAYIENYERFSPYVNLTAAIFEQAKTDWIDGWTGISKSVIYTDREKYNEAVKFLKSLDRGSEEYISLNKDIKQYDNAVKNVNTVNKFLESDWLGLLCSCCNLDIEVVVCEFEKTKNSILKMQV